MTSQTAGADTEEAMPQTSWIAKTQGWRLGAAIAIAALLLVLWISDSTVLRNCGEVRAEEQPQGKIELCPAPGPEDLLPWLLPIVLLILPDTRRLKLFGNEWERLSDEQKETASAVAAASVGPTRDNLIRKTEGDPARLVEAAVPPPPPQNVDRGQLLELWGLLQPFEYLGRRWNESGDYRLALLAKFENGANELEPTDRIMAVDLPELTEEDCAEIARWESDFASELAVVRLAVKAGDRLSQASLNEAADIALRLYGLLLPGKAKVATQRRRRHRPSRPW